MDFLKKLLPLSFGVKEVKALVIRTIIYVVAMVIAGVILGITGILTAFIPVVGAIVGLLLGAIGTLVEIYCVGGIVVMFLAYFNVIK